MGSPRMQATIAVSEQLTLTLPRSIAEEAQIRPGDEVVVKTHRAIPGLILIERPSPGK
jgi:hypothetical protein